MEHVCCDLRVTVWVPDERQHCCPSCLPLLHPPTHPPAGILYALLHVPQPVPAVPGAPADVEGALRYVLTLECDAEGLPGARMQRVIHVVVGGLAMLPRGTAAGWLAALGGWAVSCTYGRLRPSCLPAHRPTPAWCWPEGPGGHYPTQMGPWRDREPLVHWCHGATGGWVGVRL